jgi:hypothetical protein
MKRVFRQSHRPAMVVFVLVAVLCLLGTCQPPVCAAGFPGGVTHRLKQIDQYMGKVEAALAENKADRNDLERAQDSLKEINTQYPANADATEVKAAEERINKGAAAIEKLESEKAAVKEEQAKSERTADLTAEQWADRLDQYKADTKEGSKGNFGCPLSDPDKIVALAPQYKEAKAAYAEFLATGIDKESHWKLRQAEWDASVSIKNYESSINRLSDEAAEKVKQVGDFLAEQRKNNKLNWYPTDQMNALKEMVAGVNKLLPPDDPKLKSLNEAMAQVESDQAAIEKMALAKRKMKPDAYKGKDSSAIKNVAKSVIAKDQPGAKVLKVHITSSNWNTESAVEWTDTTKTAVQSRVTKGVNVQVALKKGTDCFLYTLFVHKDTIGGAAGGLTGHVMFRDKFLEANVPK